MAKAAKVRDITDHPRFMLLVDAAGRVTPQYCDDGIHSTLVEFGRDGRLRRTAEAIEQGYADLREIFLAEPGGEAKWRLYVRVYNAGEPGVWREDHYPAEVRRRLALPPVKVQRKIDVDAELRKLGLLDDKGAPVEAPNPAPAKADEADEQPTGPAQPPIQGPVKRGVS
jgi:hypothetical protein